jgi:hypothetical protein
VEPAAMAGKRDDEHKIGPSRWLLCWTAAGGSRVRLAVRNSSHPFQDARDSRRTASLLLAPSGSIINADEGGLPARDGSAREGGHGTAGWLAGCLLLFACMLFVLPRCSRRHAAGCWLLACCYITTAVWRWGIVAVPRLELRRPLSSKEEWSSVFDASAPSGRFGRENMQHTTATTTTYLHTTTTTTTNANSATTGEAPKRTATSMDSCPTPCMYIHVQYLLARISTMPRACRVSD